MNRLATEVLDAVRELAPVTTSEVAGEIGRPRSSVHRALRQLETAGLVEWDDYQRSARVYLPTPAGDDEP